MTKKITFREDDNIPDDEIHIGVVCGEVAIAIVIKAPLETDEDAIDAAIDAAQNVLAQFKETK